MEASDALALAGPRAAVSHELAALTAGLELVDDADSALRQQLVAPTELAAALLAARGRGAARLRAVAVAVDPLSGSVLEMPRPGTAHEVQDAAPH